MTQSTHCFFTGNYSDEFWMLQVGLTLSLLGGRAQMIPNAGVLTKHRPSLLARLAPILTTNK